jgi:hypothetical protein
VLHRVFQNPWLARASHALVLIRGHCFGVVVHLRHLPLCLIFFYIQRTCSAAMVASAPMVGGNGPSGVRGEFCNPLEGFCTLNEDGNCIRGEGQSVTSPNQTTGQGLIEGEDQVKTYPFISPSGFHRDIPKVPVSYCSTTTSNRRDLENSLG